MARGYNKDKNASKRQKVDVADTLQEQAHKDSPTDQNAENHKPVDFIIGTTVFTISSSVINNHKGSLLHKLLENKQERLGVVAISNDEGQIVINRSPRFFPFIKEWMEEGEIPIHIPWLLERVHEEADFYNLPEMITYLEQKANKNDKFPRYDGAYYPDRSCEDCDEDDTPCECDRITFNKKEVRWNRKVQRWTRSLGHITFKETDQIFAKGMDERSDIYYLIGEDGKVENYTFISVFNMIREFK
ncbi:hypothetical protein PROFUN_05949 [Planoprotostelium fungivorum]|uniref:Potassium channel tetramerisation-type BTB domain-containing protein n=1 Tax=Planoprotostelium fungivorum TaxID=1890364 RepID=A0A2P6N7P3_9EUKA|nr:hypothetical protein PROFUN_05949 [Planoprotostelium fungivorum]